MPMPKILVIDDKEDNLISVTAVLKSLIPDCRVITAQSGPEGIEMAKTESPDTILLDIRMPEMDGYEVCKRLKHGERTKHIPIIMLTAIHRESKDLVKGLSAGADAYLAKPLDESVLVAQVNTALRIKAAEDQLRNQKEWLEEMVLARTVELTRANERLEKEIKEHHRAEKEKRRLEDKLHRAQKMEAIGLLAGGVAHDLNNILSGLVSYPELILLHLPEDSPLKKPIKAIQESGMRAADVVEDLLTIARGVAITKEISNLNVIVEEYLASAEHRQLEKIHPFVNFTNDLDPDLLNVSCSKIHITKAIMNLVVNALEAIEGSGTVTISTYNRYVDEPLKGYEQVRRGEHTVLSVSDDGPGIPSKELERIFEPFYTKKKMGRSGTGLGLAVVWNTVQDHRGYKDVKSSDRGTVFELYFPAERKQMATREKEIPLKDYLGHGEKILVVDDDGRQRDIASALLRELDYHTAAVSSGEAAIEYVKREPVDLIVLDMVMPGGINGRKTYEEIIKIYPGQKAIIASGYAKTKEVDIAQELGAGKYIKKPYTLEKIGVAVKKELEK